MPAWWLASWLTVSTTMSVLCTPELFLPFRRACALCSSEFNVKIHSTDPNIELNEPIKLLDTTAVLTKPAFSHAAAIRPVATFGGPGAVNAASCAALNRGAYVCAARTRGSRRATGGGSVSRWTHEKTALCLPVLPRLLATPELWRGKCGATTTSISFASGPRPGDYHHV